MWIFCQNVQYWPQHTVSHNAMHSNWLLISSIMHESVFPLLVFSFEFFGSIVAQCTTGSSRHGNSSHEIIKRKTQQSGEKVAIMRPFDTCFFYNYNCHALKVHFPFLVVNWRTDGLCCAWGFFCWNFLHGPLLLAVNALSVFLWSVKSIR